MSRKRGRIVLVGVIGLDIKRSDFYEKELSFQVSCSYGPGRQSSTSYEEGGIDYPLPCADRETKNAKPDEKRNFEPFCMPLSITGRATSSISTRVDLACSYALIKQVDTCSWASSRSSSPHPTRPMKSSAKAVPEEDAFTAWTSNGPISTKRTLLPSVLLTALGATSYEEGGNDYPLPYVRWTGLKPSCRPLSMERRSTITERVSFENYAEIYDNIGKGKQHRLLAGLRWTGRTPGRSA